MRDQDEGYRLLRRPPQKRPPRPEVTRRLARPFAITGLVLGASLTVLASIVGFATSPQTASTFALGFFSVALILLCAAVASWYRPFMPMQWGVTGYAMLLAPFFLVLIFGTISILREEGRWHGWVLVSTLVVAAGMIALFVVGRVLSKAMDAAMEKD